ncbi:uncharacterized protein LAJ45_02826 [Morchella importuna]|uniref:uncharacterized protein n=1 Tax=Morchella importuna TaxID=1174673 RepID=UPI001E8D6815|nr:uncharacterized protein LAJ45_02826 [Morchella importuna]KAH8153239.1 hypothetical protein LAJ45_02826 [Morchella importuna]
MELEMPFRIINILKDSDHVHDQLSSTNHWPTTCRYRFAGLISKEQAIILPRASISEKKEEEEEEEEEKKEEKRLERCHAMHKRKVFKKTEVYIWSSAD